MIGVNVLSSLRHALLVRQLPRTYTLTEFDPQGVRFEVTNLVERYRVVDHGGETAYLHAMFNALRSDDVFYDIGANVGLVALHAARHCTTVAFEPDPSFLERLNRNLELNPTISLTTVPVAITDHDGPVVLYTDGAGGNSPSLAHQRNEEASVEVEGRSLDSLVDAGQLPAPTILKLDIEGAEILALRGALRLLRRPDAPRALFLEVHDSFLPGFDSSSEEVLRLVTDAGFTRVTYRAKRHDQQHLIMERQDQIEHASTS